MDLAIVILLLGTLFPISLQQPTLFRNTYKGLRGVLPKASLSDGEIRAVYLHDQTIAIIDLSTNNQLENCNIIEI